MDMIEPAVDAANLSRRVRELMAAGRIGAARPLLAAATALAPDNDPEIAILTAQLAQRTGDTASAMRTLDVAVEAAPQDATLRKRRAELRLAGRDGEGAARDAAEAVIFAPADPEAKAILGTALLALARVGEAIACLAEAIKLQPNATAHRETLATALQQAGRSDAALRVLADGIVFTPDRVALRNAAALTCMRRRDFRGALRIAEDARLAGVANAATFRTKGHALTRLGQLDPAVLAYHEALKLEPDDDALRHAAMAAAIPAGDDIPAAALRTLFDAAADSFDMLAATIGYSVPMRIRQILESHPAIAAGGSLRAMLDLGCGTGLVAQALNGLPIGTMTGIDLSPQMLQRADAKGLYADLREAEALTELRTFDPQSWPLVIAADMLVHLGDLSDIVGAVHASLIPGGWFVFSVEDLIPDHNGSISSQTGWASHRAGRYAHGPDYVYELLCDAGFRVVRREHLALCLEAGVPVLGTLFVAERLAHDD